MILLLFFIGIWAGVQNTLAGGGSFLTLPVLLLAGLDARAANITSTLAMFPAQCTSGLAGHSLIRDTNQVRFRVLLTLSLIGGVLGALLLLATPVRIFDALLPWLILIATTLFALGSLRKSAPAPQEIHETTHHHPPLWRQVFSPVGIGQFCVGIYGGYFGGGIGFLMMALLTWAGQRVKNAGAAKNALAIAMNASAVIIFLGSGQIHWREAMILATGGVIGALFGSWMLHKVSDKPLRILIIFIGILLTIGLFWRQLT